MALDDSFVIDQHSDHAVADALGLGEDPGGVLDEAGVVRMEAAAGAVEDLDLDEGQSPEGLDRIGKAGGVGHRGCPACADEERRVVIGGIVDPGEHDDVAGLCEVEVDGAAGEALVLVHHGQHPVGERAAWDRFILAVSEEMLSGLRSVESQTKDCGTTRFFRDRGANPP